MKCHKPNTDQDAELVVFANGLMCTEYVLPGKANSNPDVVECFIPISDNEQLTVTGTFRGSILTGCIDLLADGSYLADRRMETPHGTGVQYKKRVFDFAKVFDIPGGDPTVSPEKRVVEGHIYTERLDQTLNISESADNNCKNILGLGTLAIVIGVNQETRDLHDHKYASSTCGAWKTRQSRDLVPSGVPATHHLVVRVADDNVSSKRRSKHVRHTQQLRFGDKPWATFIFHYRSRKAVDGAGCVQSAGASHALDAGDSSTFIKAEPQKPQKRNRSLFLTPSPLEEQPVSKPSKPVHPTVIDIPTKVTPTESLQTVKPKKTKKKLFGGSLNLSPGFLSSITAAFQDPTNRNAFQVPFTMQNQFEPALGNQDNGLDDLMADDNWSEVFSKAELDPSANSTVLQQTYDSFMSEQFPGYGAQQPEDKLLYESQAHFDANTSWETQPSMDPFQTYAPPTTTTWTPQNQQVEQFTAPLGLGEFEPQAPFSFLSNTPPPSGPTPPEPTIPFTPQQRPFAKDKHFNQASPSNTQPSTPASNKRRERASSDEANATPSSIKKPRKAATELDAMKAQLVCQIEDKKRRKAALIEQEAKRAEERRLRQERKRAEQERMHLEEQRRLEEEQRLIEERQRKEEERLQQEAEEQQRAEIELLKMQSAELDDEMEVMEREMAKESQSSDDEWGEK